MELRTARQFILDRLQRGYYTFTRDEIDHAIGGGDATLMALLRLRRHGWSFRRLPLVRRLRIFPICLRWFFTADDENPQQRM